MTTLQTAQAGVVSDRPVMPVASMAAAVMPAAIPSLAAMTVQTPVPQVNSIK